MEMRRLLKANAQKIFALRLKALAAAPTAFGTSVEDEKLRGVGFFENILSAPGDSNVIFGAVVDTEIVAMVGILQTDRSKTNHKASIWGMYVDSNRRNKGIGAGLLDLAIQHAKEKMNATGVYLSVESSNSAAKNLYKSRSFRVWGTEPRALYVDGRYFDEDHMALDL
jgi:ribosomal protein S18 acetylase RimI-like enzyme